MKISALLEDKKTINRIKDIVSKLDYEFQFISPSSNLMQEIEESEADTLIVDFNHPSPKGYEFINALLTSNIKKHPYLVYLTDADQIQEVIDCLGPIPGDYFCRPIETSALIARLEVANRMCKFKKKINK